MDLYQPPPIFGQTGQKPYLSYIERESYKRIDKEQFFNELQTQTNSPDQTEFLIHEPFTQEEHDLVIQYLALMKFINPTIYQHNFPIQLEKKLPGRNRYHIQNYICDLIQRGSASYEPGERIIVKKPSGKLKDLSIKNVHKRWEKLFEMASITRERTKIKGIKHICNAAFIIFLEDIQPIVVDCSLLDNKTPTSPIVSTLIAQGLNFIESYDKCVTYGKWAVLFHRPNFYLFDFTKPGKIKSANTFYSMKVVEGGENTPFQSKNRESETSSLESDSPDETLPKVITVPSPKVSNKFIAYILNGICALYWCPSEENQIVEPRILADNDTVFACFTESDHIIVVVRNAEISYSVYEFDQDGICLNQTSSDQDTIINNPTLTLDEFEFVECNGDAIVFHNNSELTLRIYPFQNNSNQSIKQDKVYELQYEENIKKCAFANGVILLHTNENYLLICNCEYSRELKPVDSDKLYLSDDTLLYPIQYKTSANSVVVAFALVGSDIVIISENRRILFEPYKLPGVGIKQNAFYIHPNGLFIVFATDGELTFLTLAKPNLNDEI